MQELCLRCGNEPVHNQARGLGRSCYEYLRYHKTLNKFPKRNLYRRRLIEKYGREIVHDLKQHLSLKNTLEGIAKKYGISKQRTHQISNDLFGTEKFRTNSKWIRLLEKEKKRILKYHPENKYHKYGSILTVYKKLRKLGFIVTFPLEKQPYDLVVNGYKVRIRACKKPVIQNKKRYYKANLFKQERDTIDFLIFMIVGSKTFYIIPGNALNSPVIYINPKDFRHEQYKDKWEVLLRL